jgi:hypothetical protein
MRAMTFGTMLLNGDVLATPAAAQMRCHASTFVQDFDRGWRRADLDQLVHQVVGHAIEVGIEAYVVTLNATFAPAPGGRKPIKGFKGGNPVAGSIELNVHVSVCVAGFSFASTFTRRLCVGRRSTFVVNLFTLAAGLKAPAGIGTGTAVPPLGMVMAGKVRVDKFTFAPNGCVTTTC